MILQKETSVESQADQVAKSETSQRMWSEKLRNMGRKPNIIFLVSDRSDQLSPLYIATQQQKLSSHNGFRRQPERSIAVSDTSVSENDAAYRIQAQFCRMRALSEAKAEGNGIASMRHNFGIFAKVNSVTESCLPVDLVLAPALLACPQSACS